MVNYAKHRTVDSYFDIKKSWKVMSENFGDYFMVVVKSILFQIVYLLASIPIVTLIVTIPAMGLGKNIFFAEFYHRLWK